MAEVVAAYRHTSLVRKYPAMWSSNLDAVQTSDQPAQNIVTGQSSSLRAAGSSDNALAEPVLAAKRREATELLLRPGGASAEASADTARADDRLRPGPTPPPGTVSLFVAVGSCSSPGRSSLLKEAVACPLAVLRLVRLRGSIPGASLAGLAVERLVLLCGLETLGASLSLG